MKTLEIMTNRERPYDPDPDPVFHERINVLTKQGYCGFKIIKKSAHWNGVSVTAANNAGKVITSNGNTEREALKKLIDQIDLALDNKT